MNGSTRLFWSVVGLQAMFLLAWAGWHEHVRSTAPVVRLKTVPVDPRDLLRGDYMILRYEISAAPLPANDAPGRSPRGEFWVVLEPRDGYHVAAGTSWTPPAVQPGRYAVKGWRGERGGVDYGIETYYVPEGKGTPRFKTIEVEATVGPTHRLQIKRVLVDGRSYP
jgi:uncharacterized membrane-anchored protein